MTGADTVGRSAFLSHTGLSHVLWQGLAPKGEYQLNAITSIKRLTPSQINRPHAFVVQVGTKSYFFSTSDDKQREEWVQLLEAAVARLKEKEEEEAEEELSELSDLSSDDEDDD